MENFSTEGGKNMEQVAKATNNKTPKKGMTAQTRLMALGLAVSTAFIFASAWFATCSIDKNMNSAYKNFGQVLSSDIDRTVRKRLLHLLISEITIDRNRQIDSIKIKLTDELIQFLQYNSGGVPIDGTSLFYYTKELGIRFLDLKFSI